MAQPNWWKISLGLGAVGAAVGIWAALRWGDEFLNRFEDTPHDTNAPGNFVTTSAGYRLHYTSAGQGSPIVLIHGFMDSHRTWRRNVDVLASAHRVYALDMLGFGSSERVRAPIYTLKQQAQALKSFFDALQIGPAVIIGHSLGGALALQFAYDFPDLVHKLVLVAPATYLYAALPRNGLRYIPRGVARGVLGLYQRWQGSRAATVRLAYGAAQRITQDSIGFRKQMLRTRGMHDALLFMIQSKREADVPRYLQQVTVPTLIIWGRRDRVLPGSHARRHAQALPNARLEWVETAGHLPHEEQPEQVNWLLQEFLKD